MASKAHIRVTVVYSPAARLLREVQLTVPLGATVGQAIGESGFCEFFDCLKVQTAQLGVWGRKSGPAQVLRDGDRVEVYRPLTVDPKVARRERFAKQGARTAGLFEKKRVGAKAGY